MNASYEQRINEMIKHIRCSNTPVSDTWVCDGRCKYAVKTCNGKYTDCDLDYIWIDAITLLEDIKKEIQKEKLDKCIKYQKEKTEL